MHTTDPKIEPRPAAYYAGIRMKVPMQFEHLLPSAWADVAAWLQGQGIAIDQPAIIRYHTTEMDRLLDIDVALITPHLLRPSGKFVTGELPAGDYAVLDHYGPYDDDGVYQANVKIVNWAKANNIRWDVDLRDGVEWWASRVEWYFNDPDTDLNPQDYRTELTFKVQRGQRD